MSLLMHIVNTYEPEILNSALAAIVQANAYSPLAIPKVENNPHKFEFQTLTVERVTHILSTLKPNIPPLDLMNCLLLFCENWLPFWGQQLLSFFNESLLSGSFLTSGRELRSFLSINPKGVRLIPATIALSRSSQ